MKDTIPSEMMAAAPIPAPILTLTVLLIDAESPLSMPMVAGKLIPSPLTQHEVVELSSPQHHVPSVH